MMGMAYSEEKVEKARALKKVADEMGASMADLAIAWVIKNPRVTCAYVGLSQALGRNLAADVIASRHDETALEAAHGHA